MMQSEEFGFGTQIRKSPYFDATVRWGAQGFSVYNHMYIPRDFGDPEQNFWNLVNDAILCDVAVERQVEITGPDAARFTQLLTPRDLSTMTVGQCKYVLITNAEGGILNDPIACGWAKTISGCRLPTATSCSGRRAWRCIRAWMSRSPSRMSRRCNCRGRDRARSCRRCSATRIMDLRYYWFHETGAGRHSADRVAHRLVERAGLRDLPARRAKGGSCGNDHGGGMPFGLKPGHTSTIRRIEGGMLSYHADADIHTNPFELGLDGWSNLDIEADFIGKAALARIKAEGVCRKQVGLIIEGAPLPGPNTSFWPVYTDGEAIGKVTSAVHSPRLARNIALAMVAVEHAYPGAEVEVVAGSGPTGARIVERPFYDPKKRIVAA